MATKGDLSRQRIIEKSLQLFSVKGYFHTSVSDILEATGISKGGLYGHFRSKEEIWSAAFDQCKHIWKQIAFSGIRDISDPLERIHKVIENILMNYLGAGIFEGGCLMFNSLVEFSRQSSNMNDHILQGFKDFSFLLHSWLREAEQREMLIDGLDLNETANFIVIALSGSGPLYISSKDPAVLKLTLSQLSLFIDLLRKREPVQRKRGTYRNAYSVP